MKRETILVKPEKQKIRAGVMYTRVQRDRTKYTRHEKHRVSLNNTDHSIAFF